MRSVCTFVLVAAIACSGCATTGLSLSLQTGGATQQASAADGEVWRRFVMQLPIGSTLRITTTSERFTGTLLATDDQGLTAQPRTRVPEALRRIAFDEIRRVELVSDRGANLAKAVAVGAAVGAGTFLGLLILALSGLD